MFSFSTDIEKMRFLYERNGDRIETDKGALMGHKECVCCS